LDDAVIMSVYNAASKGSIVQVKEFLLWLEKRHKLTVLICETANEKLGNIGSPTEMLRIQIFITSLKEKIEKKTR
jgi:hypothetical protein